MVAKGAIFVLLLYDSGKTIPSSKREWYSFYNAHCNHFRFLSLMHDLLSAERKCKNIIHKQLILHSGGGGGGTQLSFGMSVWPEGPKVGAYRTDCPQIWVPKELIFCPI